jgi:hypothetical protein
MKARLIQEIEKHEELLKPDMDAELEPTSWVGSQPW